MHNNILCISDIFAEISRKANYYKQTSVEILSIIPITLYKILDIIY